MNAQNNISRILGLAFLLQFITSFSSGLFSVLTTFEVFFLGVLLFITLKKLMVQTKEFQS